MVTSEEEKRTEVDEDIYLSENRFEKPKEIFKSICSIVKNRNFSEQMNICDIGCSTGEFLYYFKTLFPKCSVTGLDISKSMLQVAKKMIPDGKFLEGNVDSEQLFSKNSFDVVTMAGTLSIFDDPRPSIVNCLSAIKKNGLVIISGIFNPNPVDVTLKEDKEKGIEEVTKEDAPIVEVVEDKITEEDIPQLIEK